MNRQQRRAAAADARRTATIRLPDGTTFSVPRAPGDKDEAWLKGDRAWFVEHPRRRFRVRDAAPDEFSPSTPPALLRDMADVRAAGRRVVIVVEQIRPGVRSRRPFLLGPLIEIEGLTEAGILRLFPDVADPPELVRRVRECLERDAPT
ncbi:hypothetical protein AAFN86_19585 [Roseomonas sp. CAU 1739]|uniref:hypothetical protein n=1 Tax=Roseomonas sp. CAU 1739 TaxID=3140364 RepID=UPI00325B39AE